MRGGRVGDTKIDCMEVTAERFAGLDAVSAFLWGSEGVSLKGFLSLAGVMWSAPFWYFRDQRTRRSSKVTFSLRPVRNSMVRSCTLPIPMSMAV